MLGDKVVALAFAFVMALAITNTCLAQNDPQDYVTAHNKARSAVGVGPVTWHKTLQDYAEKYAYKRKGDCQLIHNPEGKYGENLFWGGDKDKYYSAKYAVNDWVYEKQYYTYSTNKCDWGKVCDHYTQVVWRSSTKIGCARVKCDYNTGIFIVCYYYPEGNHKGQRPY